MKALITGLLVCLAAPAVAQPTLAVCVDDQGQLTNQYDVSPTQAFDVVVLLDSDGHDVSVVAWGMTDLTDAGLLKLGVSSQIGSCGLLPENCFEGSYQIVVAGCHPPGDSIEVVRIQFADFTGTVAQDFVGVIGPVDSAATETRVVDCSQEQLAATMGGAPGGTTASGVIWPDGALVLNPTRPTIDVDGLGLSSMKARY